jgi:MFS family permease
MMDKSPTTATLGTPYWFLVAGIPLVAVDVSIMDVLLPDIVAQLNISVADASLVDAVTVTVGGALMVPAGKLGDLIAPKRVLLIGLLILIASSLTTGTATGLEMLIAGRMGQGIAFAMLLTTSIAMLNHDYPQGPLRTRAFAAFVGASIAAVGLAPLIGALIGEYGSWRWAFLVNAPLAAVVVAGVYRLTPEVAPVTSTRSFDVLGSLLLAAAMGSILFAIQQGSRYGWLWSQQGIEFLGRQWTFALSPTPMLLGLGAVLLTAFVSLERSRERRQLDVVLDTRLFQMPSYVCGTVAVGMAASASIGALLIVSLYAEYILGASAISAGLMAAPMGLAVLITGPVSARLAQLSGKTVSLASVGTQLIAVLILIAAFSLEGLPLLIGAAMFLLGISWIVSMSAITSLVLAEVPAQLSGEAVGVQTSVRYLICGFAMVVMTTLLISVTAVGVHKVSFTGLSAADRTTLDAVERLKRPAIPRVLADAANPTQRKEFERYNQTLNTARRAMDEGTRAAAIVVALMLVMALVMATRLPARTAPPLSHTKP